MADKTLFYHCNEVDNDVFYQMPKGLLENDEYKDLSLSAKVLYMILRDRNRLSLANGWSDNEGRVYIIYPVDDLAGSLNVTKKTIIKGMNELKEYGLVYIVRQGAMQPNIIYVMKLKNYVPRVKKIFNDEENTLPLHEVEKIHFNGGKNTLHEVEKIHFNGGKNTLHEVEKIHTNNNDVTNTDNNENENNMQRPKKTIEESKRYGEYENVLLTDKQIEKLKEKFPNDWNERIEKVSCYCASKGKSYKDYLATIESWAIKEKNGDNDGAKRYNAKNAGVQSDYEIDEQWAGIV